MISQPINLAKFYELSFRGAKALINQISWDKVPGQNKLRKFFLRDNWQDDIVRISVSSSGAKGGVFFLEVDLLDKQSLDQVIGDVVKANEIWQQLVKDELISVEGIKTATGRSGVLPPRRAAYTNNVTKIGNLLRQANVRRQFVVKGTEEPGRTLFAEYVLNRVGKAKIPKSLVLTVDPADNTSEGMIMLRLLSDPNKRNPNSSAQVYANSYAFLDDGQGTPNSYISYLVIQKLIVGTSLPIVNDVNAEILDFLVEQKIKITEASFLTDANFQGISKQAITALVNELKQQGCISNGGIVDDQYQNRIGGLTQLNQKQNEITQLLQASRAILNANNLQFTTNSTYNQFDELDVMMQNAADGPLKQAWQALRTRQARYMQTVETILGNPEQMFNVGCILFADLPIGNGDRFENMNSGNFFFVNKVTTRLGKVNYPIGCIDNDAFLHTYLPTQLLPQTNPPQTEGFATVDDYVNGLLQDGTPELWASNAPPPAVLGPSAMVEQMMDVVRWFSRVFMGAILNAEMPKCVVRHLSANYYEPTDNAMYAQSKQKPGWQVAKQHIQEGFCKTLLAYQGIPLYEFRQVYATLADQYGRGPNFDFIAFEVRDRYLREVQVNPTNWTVVLPDFNTIKTIIVADFKPRIGGSELSKIIQVALDSVEGQTILKKANVTKEQITKLLLMLSIREQENLIPCPFGLVLDNRKKHVHFGDLAPELRAKLLARWAELKPKYQIRINAVIVTILAKFYTDYERETRHIRLRYAYIQDTLAYPQALNDAEEFSAVKLYKVDGGQKRSRKDKLAEWGLGDYI